MKDLKRFRMDSGHFGVDMHDWKELYDYPMSWNNWRALCIYHGGYDPGPNELPEHNIEELAERLSVLEQGQTAEPWISRQWDVVDQLKAQALHLQRKLIELENLKSKKKARY